jgi:hypothetical protein
MQYHFEEVGSEQRFIDNASPLRARRNPFVYFVCSRGPSQILDENLCPAGDHILLILHPKFREEVKRPEGHKNVKQVGKIQQTNPNNQIAVPICSRLFFGENLFVDCVHKKA